MSQARLSDAIATRDLPPLTLRASFVPATINVEKRTVDLTWTTGARVLRGFYEKFYEELSLNPKHVRLARLNNSAPLLDGHPLRLGDARAVNVRGIVVPGTAKTNGKEGTCQVRFAQADVDPEADILFRKVQDGIVANVSCGYRIYKLEKSEESVDKVPVYRVIDWEPFEISTVSAGEDDGAGFRSALHMPNPCEFIGRGVVDAPGLRDDDRNRRLRLAKARI